MKSNVQNYTRKTKGKSIREIKMPEVIPQRLLVFTCPYCNHEHKLDYSPYNIGFDSDEPYVCDNCEKSFMVNLD